MNSWSAMSSTTSLDASATPPLNLVVLALVVFSRSRGRTGLAAGPCASASLRSTGWLFDGEATNDLRHPKGNGRGLARALDFGGWCLIVRLTRRIGSVAAH